MTTKADIFYQMSSFHSSCAEFIGNISPSFNPLPDNTVYTGSAFIENDTT